MGFCVEIEFCMKKYRLITEVFKKIKYAFCQAESYR